MEGMESVIEAPETGAEVESEPIETGTETQETQQAVEKDDPYSSKYTREMSQALKALRETNPEAAKYLRQAKDDHSRLAALHQMEQRGIDGVRETYALLDSVVHGELKGIEAVTALQDEIRSVQQTDEFLAAGDPRALDDLGDQFNEGLAKLTPTILDRVRESNPEAYAEAILPHFVEALKSSDLVRDFNAMVDVLNEKPPSWLPPERMQAWRDDWQQRVVALAGNQARWFNAQMQKAAGAKQPEAKAGAQRANGKEAAPSEQEKFHKEQQDHHWKTNIKPGLDTYANTKFQEQFRPYAKRLRLDAPATSALRSAFIQGVVGKAGQNKGYMDQIGRYHSQRNPDPKTVLNFAKVEFDKHAKSVMEGLVNERYKPFLNGKPSGNQNGNGTARKTLGPVAPGVEIRNIKPPSNEIDFPSTPLEWLRQHKYKMQNGKVIQVRQNA